MVARKSAKTTKKTSKTRRSPADAPPTTGPRPGEVLQAEMARRLEITAQSCGMWCKRPDAPVRVDGKNVYVRAAEFIRWREKELVAAAIRQAMPTVSFDTARTRKALAEAERAEIEVAQMRGDVVAISDFVAALDRVLVRLTARLRAMPVRFAHLGDDVEAAAEVEVERIITELNRFDEDVLDEPDEDDEPRRTSVTDDEDNDTD